MTKEQQEIIDSLVAEFERINTQKTKEKCNLIDISPLVSEVSAGKFWDKLVEEDDKRWSETANLEARRIVELLREDLEDYCVQKFGKENGYSDLPVVLIRKSETWSTHPDNSVRIEVVVKKEHKDNEYGHRFYFGSKLRYSFYGKVYDNIMDVTSSDRFKQELLSKVIK